MLVEHAKRELQLAEMFYKDADYSGEVAHSVMELIEVFAKQGHSGMSAALTLELFAVLARFNPLTPLNSNPDDWFDITEMSGSPKWQSKRKPSAFSRDGGKTWYDLDERAS